MKHIFSLLLLLFVSFVFAQEPKQVSVTIIPSQERVHPGSDLKVAVKLNIAKEWHINSNKPHEDFLIATELSFKSPEGVVLFKTDYPKGKDLKFAFSENPVSVYEGEVIIYATLQVPPGVPQGEHKGTFVVGYQPCNDKSCAAPDEVEAEYTFKVVDKNESVVPVNQDIFKAQAPPQSDKSDFTSQFEERGLFLSLLFMFIVGLGLNLTPCVYPLIPVTISIFGSQSGGSTKKLAGMGGMYVLGIALTYSVIGVVTSLTGAVFGALLQNPFVVIFVAAVLVGLSLSMFGVYDITVPEKLMTFASGNKGGVFGAFFMGLTMGIVAAPCIGPFVLGLVTYVAAKGDPLTGFLLFFFMALGLGAPYFVLAIYSGKISKLPRSGVWMEAVKHIFGFILIGMALYFIAPLIKLVSDYILPVYMVLAGLYLLIFEKAGNKLKGFKNFRMGFSIVVIIAGVWLLIPTHTPSIAWTKYSKEIHQAGLPKDKKMIMDFYADWCIPCKELDKMTFSDAKVIEATKSFTALKVDLTASTDLNEEIKKQYKIVGVPTVLLFNSKGEEKHRIVGFMPAAEFLKLVEGLD